MRGDQLDPERRLIRGRCFKIEPGGAIEASSKRLTVAEIAQREETGIRTIYHELEAYQTAGFLLYSARAQRTNRWAFLDTFKFKVPFLFQRPQIKEILLLSSLS